MTDARDGQLEGPEAGASDNAAENAAPDVADEVTGENPLSQPRTGAETPVDAEDLVHAQGQDATPENLERAQQRLDTEGREAVEDVLPDR